MKSTLWRSIGAVLAGFFTGAILSTATDQILANMNLMNMVDFKANPWWLILLVVFYRFLFNITGCYVTARLAPDKPMRHAMVIGVGGTFLGILGSILMWDQSLAWFNLAIILISIPSAWIGAMLLILQRTEVKK
jgi:phosphatidylglycerophosphate synthase